MYNKKISKRWPHHNKPSLNTLLLSCILLVSLVVHPVVADDNEDVDLTILGELDITGDLTEGTEHIIHATIYNDGSDNITIPFKVSLYVDKQSTATSTKTISSLKKRKSTEINLTWQAIQGSHTLTVFVDSDNSVKSERDEFNNQQDLGVTIKERSTDITFQPYKIYYKGTLRASQNNTIQTTIVNLGKNTSTKINASLYVSGKFIESTIISGLSKNTLYNLSFQWKPPKHGSYKINITLDPKNAITEYNESNNFIEETVQVSLANLKWWDTTWHYRKFYDLIGKGNISVDVNFSSYLADLNIENTTLEKDTITIIQYHTNGTIDRVITNFTYNTTAQKILWEAQNAYYCIYFDVEENMGTRIPTPPLPTMNASGTAQILATGPPEGWQLMQDTTLPYYLEPRETLNLYYTTAAVAQQITAAFYFNNSWQETVDLQSSDNLHWTGSFDIPDRIGEWELSINGTDNAGYHPDSLSDTFYVGYPDLVVESIDFTPDVTDEDPFYQGRNLTITANIHTINTSVKNINVTLFIDGEYIDSYDNITLLLANPLNVEFDQKFDHIGTFNVSVEIDPNDDIEELPLNENNNEQWKLLTVNGIPDLTIDSIYLANQTVDQGDPVTVYTEINNTGTGNATNYQINLYFEQHKKDTMTYAEPKATTTFSVPMNESKNISITWNSAAFGESKYEGRWITGVQIITSDNKPDKNIIDNTGALYKPKLLVIPEESNPPLIIITAIADSEQHETVEIRTRVTDDSGIKKVELTITNPNKKITRLELTDPINNYYIYEYTETDIIGTYNITVTATDKSIYSKNTTKTETFRILPDRTPPTFEFSGVSPHSQLPENDLTFTCIVTDLSTIKTVRLTITDPNNKTDQKTMTKTTTQGKYTVTTSFETIGKYTYQIQAEDTQQNQQTTNTQTFWITPDLNDTDNDGIPNWWEAKYGLDMYNPNDANNDNDNDGETNIEEYKKGTNPLKSITSASEILKNLEENAAYFAASLFLFILLLLFALYSYRRL